MIYLFLILFLSFIFFIRVTNGRQVRKKDEEVREVGRSAARRNLTDNSFRPLSDRKKENPSFFTVVSENKGNGSPFEENGEETEEINPLETLHDAEELKRAVLFSEVLKKKYF